TVSFAADRLMERVGNQVRHSPKPLVPLTGGCDSRSIVAAAKKTGHDFTAFTGGPPDSEDAVVAARVAKALNVKHNLLPEVASPALLLGSISRMRTWIRMTEGIMPINYSLHLKDFFESKLPFPAGRFQYFHGVEPGIGRGLYYPPGVDAGRFAAMTIKDAHAFVAATYKNRYLKLSKASGDMFEGICLRLDEDLRETGGKINHWFELLMWRERGLNWGMDLQSVNTPVRWAWAPLYDRELMALSWNLSADQMIEGQLLFDVPAALQGALAGFPRTSHACGGRPTLAARIRHRVLTGARRYSERVGIKKSRPEHQNGDEWDVTALWKGCLLNGKTHVWNEFIDRKDLLKVIAISPRNALLWRLLTIDFLAEAFF
nr:asparagine synthase-related protein [Nitrospiraceae bacterium]